MVYCVTYKGHKGRQRWVIFCPKTFFYNQITSVTSQGLQMLSTLWVVPGSFTNDLPLTEEGE